jgi:hypothetical protein
MSFKNLFYFSVTKFNSVVSDCQSMEARFYGHHIGAHNFEEGNVQPGIIQIVAEYACIVRSVLVPSNNRAWHDNL